MYYYRHPIRRQSNYPKIDENGNILTIASFKPGDIMGEV